MARLNILAKQHPQIFGMNSGCHVKLTRNQTEVFLVENSNFGQEQIEPLRRFLDPVETARSQRFRFRGDHDSFVIVHGLLRLILSYQLGISPREVKLDYNKYGKPLLSGKQNKIRFSLSHSCGISALAFSLGYKIGVDVEYMNSDFKYGEVSEQFFTSEENSFINAGTEGASDRFYRLWTRKEALLKAIGTGLSGKLDVDVLQDIRTIEPDFESKSISGPDRYILSSTLFENDYMVSLASGDGLAGIRLHLPSGLTTKLT
ncbi:MAG: 4'-phosphopantetheinyl transferase superfamily protein [Bacteroidetes bacterium]|nr:4'-phosphopantetheinyl transferase superfamily protein [Bacteroidota bacterium]